MRVDTTKKGEQMVPRRIVVASDGSEPSLAAEAFAADMASLMTATGGEMELVVCMVVRPRDAPAERGAFALWPLSDEEFDDAVATVNQAAERVSGLVNSAGTVHVKPLLVETRRPAEGIVEAAHGEGGCSLIVMGNRGHGGFASMMLGSVSQQVLHEAHCPVVVVKS